MGMKKTLLCATAVAALSSTALVANAEEGWYGRADLGYGFGGQLDHDPAFESAGSLAGDSDVDGTYLGDLGLGFGFNNGFRLEGVVGYRSGELDEADGVNGIPADITDVNTGTVTQFSAQSPDGNAQILDFMLNGIYDFNREGSWQPYLGAGLGVAKVKAKASSLGFGTVTPTTSNVLGSGLANGFSDTETAFAYQGLVGLGYALSERLKLDLGYRYYVVEDLDFNGRDPLGNDFVYDSNYTCLLYTSPSPRDS